MPASDHGSVVFTLHDSRATAGIAYGKYRTKRKRVYVVVWCLGFAPRGKDVALCVSAFHPQWDS